MQRGHELGNTNQQHDRGKHLTHDHVSEEDLFPFEVHTGQSISRRDPAQHGQGSSSARNKQGVQQKARDTPVDDIRQVAPDPPCREHVQEIHVQTLRIGAESGDEHHIIGIKRHNTDDDYKHIQAQTQQAALNFPFPQGKSRQQRNEERRHHHPDQCGMFDIQSAQNITDGIPHLPVKQEAVHECVKSFFSFCDQTGTVQPQLAGKGNIVHQNKDRDQHDCDQQSRNGQIPEDF